MRDHCHFFDKRPDTSYCVGPTAVGAASTGYNVLWRAWHEPEVGTKYVQNQHYSFTSPTGHLVSGSDTIVFTDTLSFAFGESSQPWVAYENESTIRLIRFSGTAGAQETYLFSGESPALYFNTATLETADRLLSCYYLKDNNIFLRSSKNSFVTEELAFSGLPWTPTRLNQVIMDSRDNRKTVLYGLTSSADGFALESSIYQPVTGTRFTTNFEHISVGRVNESNPNRHLLGALFFMFEEYGSIDFSIYPTGYIENLPLGSRMYGGTTWL